MSYPYSRHSASTPTPTRLESGPKSLFSSPLYSSSLPPPPTLSPVRKEMPLEPPPSPGLSLLFVRSEVYCQYVASTDIQSFTRLHPSSFTGPLWSSSFSRSLLLSSPSSTSSARRGSSLTDLQHDCPKRWKCHSRRGTSSSCWFFVDAH